MQFLDQEFRVTINNEEYLVDTSEKTFNVSRERREYLTQQSGECNPLRALWDGWKWHSAAPTERAAMEQKCIQEAVEYEINAHLIYCLELIESGEIDGSTGREK